MREISGVLLLALCSHSVNPKVEAQEVLAFENGFGTGLKEVIETECDMWEGRIMVALQPSLNLGSLELRGISSCLIVFLACHCPYGASLFLPSSLFGLPAALDPRPILNLLCCDESYSADVMLPLGCHRGTPSSTYAIRCSYDSG